MFPLLAPFVCPLAGDGVPTRPVGRTGRELDWAGTTRVALRRDPGAVLQNKISGNLSALWVVFKVQ